MKFRYTRTRHRTTEQDQRLSNPYCPYLEGEHTEIVVDILGMAQLVSWIRRVYHCRGVLGDSLHKENRLRSDWAFPQTADSTTDRPFPAPFPAAEAVFAAVDGFVNAFAPRKGFCLAFRKPVEQSCLEMSLCNFELGKGHLLADTLKARQRLRNGQRRATHLAPHRRHHCCSQVTAAVSYQGLMRSRS